MNRILLALTGLVAVPVSSFGQVPAQWVGPAAGVWSDASNWSTAPNFPGDGKAEYAVDLSGVQSATIDLDIDVELQSFTLSDGVTLRVPFPSGGVPVRVDGALTLAGGLIVTGEGDGALGGASLCLAGSVDGAFNVAYLPGFPMTEGETPRYYFVRKNSSSLLGVGPAGPGAVMLTVETLGGAVLVDPPSLFGNAALPTDAVLGDLNNDGLDDLALAVPDPSAPTTEQGSVIVMYNAGAVGGTWLGYGATAQVTVGVDPSAVDIGDADREGGLDIAVANRGDNTASVIRNDGTGLPGALFSKIQEPTGLQPSSISFGELDEDKWDDIVVANFGSGDITIFENAQELEGAWGGLFSKGEMPVGLGPIDVLFAELDEDKWDDIIVADRIAGTIIYIDNTFPPGTLAQPLVIAGQPGVTGRGAALPLAGTSELSVSDLNGDGLNDITATNTGADNVSIVLGHGDGTFKPDVNVPSAPAPVSLTALDLDNDADLDLAVVAGEPARVTVLRNDLTEGQLVFSPASDIDSGGVPLLVRSGDVDGDGQTDLVIVNDDLSMLDLGPSGGGTISVVLQSGASTACAGDCDGDGVVGFFDLTAMLEVYEMDAIGSACDTDGSGFVDFDDLVAALFVFGPCM